MSTSTTAPGDIPSRLDALDEWVMSFDLVNFAMDLLDVMKDASSEISDSSYKNEALILCGECNNIDTQERSGTIGDDQLVQRKRQCFSRGLSLKEKVIDIYTRRRPRQ